MISYPSTPQFRGAITQARKLLNSPQIEFTGSVKVHGTNASVLLPVDNSISPQAKTRTLTIEKDNAGFAAFTHQHSVFFESIRQKFIDASLITEGDDLCVYGEFAGGKIHKSADIAIYGLPKFFCVFGASIIKDETNHWLDNYPVIAHHDFVIDVRQIWQKKITIDFHQPQRQQNILIEITNAIEQKCPVGTYFGVDGIGEGVVWHHITPSGERIAFKVKGDKHSVTKVKKLAAVDTERLASIDAFVDYAVTENRLLQALDEVSDGVADRTKLGAVIKWIAGDVIKEESDTLCNNGLSMRDVGGGMAHKCKSWVLERTSS